MKERSRTAVFLLIAAVYGLLIGSAVIIAALVSYDGEYSEEYIDLLQTMLSWPTLGFALLMTALIVFHRELKTMISNLYLKNLSTKGAEFEMRPQLDPPPGDRPIRDESEINEFPLYESADLPPSVLTEQRDAALKQAAEWEEEANRWWNRYLAVFLAPDSLYILATLKDLAPLTREEYLRLGRRRKKIIRGRMYEVPDERIPYSGDEETRTKVLGDVLSVLGQYGLIEVANEKIQLTDVGSEFLDFLETPDGTELLDHLYPAGGILVS